MTHKKIHVRSGLTAIAAVLALTSTPLVAQEVTTPPDPATETPSSPPPVADPLAPEPAASEPAAAEPEATAPAETAAPATTRRTARARMATTSRAPSQPARTAAPVSPAPTSEAAMEPLPVAPPTPAPMAEPIAPPAAQPVAAPSDVLADETLPIAGAAGLGLLALAGIGLAVRRRRRRREEMEHYEANQLYLAEHPEQPTSNAPVPSNNEPAFVRASQPAMAAVASDAAVRTDVPRTNLPSGFDLSRFGPHVRAAYQGPTPDNPSLSLKYRLRRAGAMDKRAKMEAEQRPQVEATARRPEPARQPAWSMNEEGFMLRRAGGRPSKPAQATTRH